MRLASCPPRETSARWGLFCFPKSLDFGLFHSPGAFIALAGILFWATAGRAQDTPYQVPAPLPDAPQASVAADSSSASPDVSPGPVTQTPPSADRAPQTKRILGIIPNFRSVSTDQTLPPQTVKEKFFDATQDSFDYSSVFIPGFLAGYSMATNAYPEFGHGGVGYARYFWHAAVDQTSENYLVEFIVPTVTREDTRFYTLSHGGFLKRAGYAMSRAVVTRTDTGRETFNFSEVVGSGASSGLSTLYYPSRERSLGNVGTEWGLDVGIDSASFLVREFWPDVNRKLFRSKASATQSR